MSSSEAPPPPELGTLLEHWARFGDDAEAATAVWSEDPSAQRHTSPSSAGGICSDCDLGALSTLLPLPDAADPFADGFLDIDDDAFALRPEALDKSVPQNPAVSAEEEARRAARLARNREAAALSRARRRAAADGLEARCSGLEAQNRELLRQVAALTNENDALRRHILATCPPPAPAAAPLAAVLPLGAVPLAVLPPTALPLLPLPKLPLPKLAAPQRPAPAPPARKPEAAGKAEPASKRKRTTFAAAAAALVALAVIGSPFSATFNPPTRAPDAGLAALPTSAVPAQAHRSVMTSLQANSSTEALHLANALLESARAAALDFNASSAELAPFLLLAPPGAPPASAGGETDASLGALVPLFPGSGDDSTALLHTQWLEETWRPLLSLPLSDERAQAALKALSVYAVATGSGAAGDVLGMRAPWSALQSAWPATAPPALSCRRLFEFTSADDFPHASAEAGEASSAASMPRALRRFGGAWPLPPSASEAAAAGPRAADAEVTVSLLQPPTGYTIGGTPTVGGSSAGSVLVVVLIRGAQRYLTFACNV